MERTVSLADLVKFTMATLKLWATKRTWGEIRIVVQDGQIVHVSESKGYKGALPAVDISAT